MFNVFQNFEAANFKWDEEAEEAFLFLKKYLAELRKLMSPLTGKVLFLYVFVSDYSISVVLVAEREKRQLSVYYISHAF